MSMGNTENASNKGLTLIELVVAVMIMAIGAVSLMAVLVNSERASRASQAKSLALNAAEEQMEAIFWDAPTSVMDYNGQTFAVGNLQGAGGNLPGTITVANTQPREVTVAVQWIGTGIVPAGSVTIRALRSTATR
jgi:prepilin-type N-terminal cleavage/methylation domain-containing protein